MQARRAARELAFILFSQLDKNITEYNIDSWDDIMLKSVRILSDDSKETLKLSLGTLIDMKNRIEDYESEHETNLNRPIGATNIPVPMPSTSDVIEKINAMIDVAEKSIQALEIAEFATLESHSEVKDYALKITQTYKDNFEEIDSLISQYTKGWDFDRLVKMDRDILRIAISEILFIKETPIKVAIDEALELSKKYSTQDSPSFINGVIAKVVLDKGL